MQVLIPDFVDTQVRVVSVFSARTARVHLANGREVFGYVSESAAALTLQTGADYHVRLFVADFSRAELLAPVEPDQIAKSI